MGRAFLTGNLGLLLFLTIALPARGQSEPSYVGNKTCAKCHAAETQKWAQSLHSEIMQPATVRSVEGDFAQSKVELRGSPYLFERRDGNYFITESDLTGKPWEHHVDYTLGRRRIQQYLTRLPDGRIIVLPPSWDNLRKLWVHDIDIDNPEEDPSVQIQTWNKTCYSCHVSQEKKNFDLEQNSYHTTWQELGVSCESCHGPGSEHVNRASRAEVLNAASKAAISRTILDLSKLTPLQSTMVCAQCHSFRDIYVDGFEAGQNYFDHFLPVMQYRLPTSDDPAYWPDGRPRWLSNETFGLWQSGCFLKGGATCVTCHSDSHDIDVEQNPELRTDSNALCARCHAKIAAHVSAHSHHAAKSAGSSCIACHMPATVIGLGAHVRDHSMSVPVPENTIRHGIPNACNLCHKDKDADWALHAVDEWYDANSQWRQALILRADAFTDARKGDVTAVPELLQILSDPSGGSLIRANAAGYLGNFPGDPSAYDAVLHSFTDSDPLVRATAASAIEPSPAQREALAPALVSLLADPAATVRVSAAIALVSMGVQTVPDKYAEPFARAKEMYRARAELDSDDARQQFAAGRFFFLSGDFKSSVAFFRASLKLDPKTPAQYNLALALAKTGDAKDAKEILSKIPEGNPDYAPAQRLLASLALSNAGESEASAESKSASASDDSRKEFLEGQFLYQNQNYGGALEQLNKALQLAPQGSWAAKAQIYRAVCLEKLGRAQEAEAAMRALSGNPEARDDVDLQLAHVELLYESGRTEEALKRIDALIAAAPNTPVAYSWCARVLLQLHRTDEAAKAAEESIRLMPDLAAAHNLLMKIYQMQGRTKEAAEQAQWLRDYERRKP